MAEVKFTKTHEWVKIEGEIATVGITNHAQSELGDIVFVELPSAGDKVKSKEQLATIESTKAAAEVYAPISGEITEINSELSQNPQFINEDPYGKGWMVKIKIDNAGDIPEFMDEASYNNFIEKET
ncbi:MAG: glycine cleavage system protein H [Candidatus Omnitrophica bacterium 4484_171]|nr:MAG: glycine cleavage system protein H [Candidatus Omnitrophica bacterium 4484_171]